MLIFNIKRISKKLLKRSNLKNKFMLAGTKGTTYVPVLMMIASILGPMSMIILAPALPLMEAHFNTTADSIQRLLSINLAAIAISGFIYGPVSESFGRRCVFLIGISIFYTGAFLSYFAKNLKLLMFFQIIQGTGIGVGALTIAITRDLYHGEKAAKIISLFGIMIPLVAAITPYIGGIIIKYLGWPIIFLLLGSLGVCFFLLLYFGFPETLSMKPLRPYCLKNQIKSYRYTLTNINFLKFWLIMNLSFSGLWIYQTTAPFVFIQHFKLSPSNYGIYPIISSSGLIFGNMFVHRFSYVWKVEVILKIGAIASLLAAITLLLLSLFHCVSPLWFALSMTFYCFGCGPAFSVGIVLAMENVFHGKGYGAALIRGGQFAFASLTVTISGFLYTDSFLWPGFLILISTIAINSLIWTLPYKIS